MNCLLRPCQNPAPLIIKVANVPSPFRGSTAGFPARFIPWVFRHAAKHYFGNDFGQLVWVSAFGSLRPCRGKKRKMCIKPGVEEPELYTHFRLSAPAGAIEISRWRRSLGDDPTGWIV